MLLKHYGRHPFEIMFVMRGNGFFVNIISDYFLMQTKSHKLSKTLGNINVDWHNLILSRLCTLDTCAIGDKILSTDWQLSC